MCVCDGHGSGGEDGKYEKRVGKQSRLTDEEWRRRKEMREVLERASRVKVEPIKKKERERRRKELAPLL
jgi:hypothetical protein